MYLVSLPSRLGLGRVHGVRCVVQGCSRQLQCLVMVGGDNGGALGSDLSAAHMFCNSSDWAVVLGDMRHAASRLA
jgi:hypothetical protein